MCSGRSECRWPLGDWTHVHHHPAPRGPQHPPGAGAGRGGDDRTPAGGGGGAGVGAGVGARPRRVRLPDGDDVDGVAGWRSEAIRTPGSAAALFGERALPIAGAGTPAVAEFAVMELAAVLDLSHEAALALVGDVLDLAHRLPRLWGLVQGAAGPGPAGPRSRPGLPRPGPGRGRACGPAARLAAAAVEPAPGRGAGPRGPAVRRPGPRHRRPRPGHGCPSGRGPLRPGRAGHRGGVAGPRRGRPDRVRLHRVHDGRADRRARAPGEPRRPPCPRRRDHGGPAEGPRPPRRRPGPRLRTPTTTRPSVWPRTSRSRAPTRSAAPPPDQAVRDGGGCGGEVVLVFHVTDRDLLDDRRPRFVARPWWCRPLTQARPGPDGPAQLVAADRREGHHQARRRHRHDPARRPARPAGPDGRSGPAARPDLRLPRLRAGGGVLRPRPHRRLRPAGRGRTTRPDQP